MLGLRLLQVLGLRLMILEHIRERRELELGVELLLNLGLFGTLVLILVVWVGLRRGWGY